MPLYSFGSNARGQLSTNNRNDASLPTLCQTLSPALLCQPPRKIACGANHTAIVTVCGQLLTCGSNDKGQLGFDSAGEDVLTLRELEFTAPDGQPVLFADVGCGWDFTIALSSQGSLWVFGSNESGQLGLGESSNKPSSLIPVQLPTIQQPMQKIACGVRHSLSIDTEGHVWGWGSNRFGEAGTPSPSNSKPPQVVPTPSLVTREACKDVACGQHHSILLTVDNEVLVFGKNKHGVLGLPITSISITPAPIRVTLPPEAANVDLKKVFAGWGHSGVLTSDGNIYMWGRCDHGQLATSNTPSTNTASSILHTHTPAPCSTLPPIIDVSSASESCLAFDTTGLCWAWGWNEHGNCGVEHLEDVVVPDVVKVGGRVEAVGCGYGHALIWVDDRNG